MTSVAVTVHLANFDVDEIAGLFPEGIGMENNLIPIRKGNKVILIEKVGI